MICPECGKPCNYKKCDSGIGPGEFAGVPFHDSKPYIGSDCCEADLECADESNDDGRYTREDYESDRRREKDDG